MKAAKSEACSVSFFWNSVKWFYDMQREFDNFVFSFDNRGDERGFDVLQLGIDCEKFV